eukprot:CAMPEP_0197520180 /NCGR_PEP_ID=MMETSP1318-20131121/5488_1 /TAXON_ID=552666 /ORGANISM="Partenskyella glossopodia, Strain RCC365" /LENGTH=364 /DNA_ID=CAMNT_0043071597 /DNA_START=222 /DNA_END=1316 /DNA_ORIENTATION=+
MSKEKWLSKKLVVKELDRGGGGKSGDGSEKRPAKREIKLTVSGIYLYNAVRTLLEADLVLVVDEKVLPYATLALYGTVAKGIVNLLDSVITHQAKTATKLLKKEKEAQHLSILANFQFLLADLLPRVSRSIATIFKRKQVSQVNVFESRLKELSKALLRSFCKRRAEVWLEILNWNPKNIAKIYSHPDAKAGEASVPGDEKDDDSVQNLIVSDSFIRVLESMYALMDNIATHLNKRATTHILGESLECLMRQVAAADRIKGVVITRRGLQHLYLDISFIMKATGGYLTETSLKYAKSLMKASRLQYCRRTKSEESTALNSRDFFDKKISEQLKVTKPLSAYVAVDRTEKKRKKNRRDNSPAATK